ncbi:MAG: hypothetical protein KDA52_13375 [Planctomycetaceae bacterium]|nr:hypothetical protein [Planctomycetaceae bacterium]
MKSIAPCHWGDQLTNCLIASIETMITQTGIVWSWTVRDTEGNAQTLTSPLHTGQSIHLAPGESIQLEYTATPKWRWRSVP